MEKISTEYSLANSTYDIEKVRADFPCINQEINGYPLTFLDSAASAQKPKAVIDALHNFYGNEYANIHRGIYYLSSRATEKFEDSRRKVSKFINANSDKEVIFTRGATEAINLVASSYGRTFLEKGDEVLISHMEHHANFVPWQQLCKEMGLKLKICPITDEGELDIKSYKNLLSNKTKFVAISHMSNALGVINPAKEIVNLAHKVGAKVLLDGCQAIVHLDVDMQELNCDFYVFSGHKLYGPSGIGVLYGKYDLLDQMPPYQTGGEMIDKVTIEETTFLHPPLRFEAGTPAIAEAIGLGAAIDYIERIGKPQIREHEKQIFDCALQQIEKLDQFRIICNAKERACIIPFVHESAHPSDIGSILDKCGVAIRTGHHCAQPLLSQLGYNATARASIGMYTSFEDIDRLISAMKKVTKFF